MSLKNILSNIDTRHCLLIFFTAIIINIFPVFLGSMSVDACVYLDAGRNLFEGRGFTSSYNYYQYWSKDAFYPAFQFLPPVFPIIAGLIWKISHSIEMVAFFNVFIGAINCALLYIILRHVFPQRPSLSLWSGILVALSRPMQLVSIYAWTEQLHLLSLLIAIFLFMRSNSLKQCLVIGLLLGLGFFIRPAAFYNLIAFLIILLFFYRFKREAFTRCVLVICGFLILFLPYQAFCKVKYKAWYPEYVNAGQTFSFAFKEGGYYSQDKPVLRVRELSLNERLAFLRKNLPINLKLFAEVSWHYLGVLGVLCIWRFFLLLRQKNSKEHIFLIIGLVNILFYSTGFYLTPIINLTEATRFSLIHFVLFIPLGVASLFKIIDIMRIKFSFKFMHNILLFSVVFYIAASAFQINSCYFDSEEYFKLKLARQELFPWVRKNTRAVELIATSEYQSAFELSRPIVALPEEKMLTAKNLNSFLNIYKPRYIIFSKRQLSIYKDFLAGKGRFYSQGNWQKYYSVFEPD